VIKYAVPALILIHAPATLGETQPTPIPRFDAIIATTSAEGVARRPIRIRFIAWELTSKRGASQEIPLKGFYLAHLLSGTVSTTIGGQTIVRQAGSFWTVGDGAEMQLKVLGEGAELETIVLTNR
jgi:hypothetical protein